MNYTLCAGKCYHEYPGRQDPYRRPCVSEGKCILMTSVNDGEVDCYKATDEQGRPWYADLNLVYTLMLSLAVVILSWLLHKLINTGSKSLGSPEPHLPIESNPSVNPTQTPAIPLANLTPEKSLDPTSPSPKSSGPSLLDHQALVEIDNPKWSWQEIGEELGIEDIFMNQDPQSLVAPVSYTHLRAHET